MCLPSLLVLKICLSWVEQISRLTNINFVSWLLVSYLIQLYIEKQQEQENEIQNVQLEEKKRKPGYLKFELRVEE